ncbi:MAG: hypothetical protein J5I59_06355 [Saprospiraceae bacterium]|nr:hypothetical protein [Saprospiraceae bacterium]
MKFIFSIITPFLLFLSCNKENVVSEYVLVRIPCTLSRNLDTAKIYIQGDWSWLEEKRYSRGLQKTVYLTPHNQGYTFGMKLSNDTAYFYKNNKLDSVYLYKVFLQGDVTGTDYPEDSEPALVFYRIYDGKRNSYVPLKICSNYLILQYQFVTSNGGETVWKKQ